jgi:hypothetical protein
MITLDVGIISSWRGRTVIGWCLRHVLFFMSGVQPGKQQNVTSDCFVLSEARGHVPAWIVLWKAQESEKDSYYDLFDWCT